MDEKTQIETIMARLTGLPVPASRADRLDEPWRTIYHRVQPAATRDEAIAMLSQAVAGLKDLRQIARKLADNLPAAYAFTAPSTLHDLEPKITVHPWLWPGWIPIGHVTILAAEPGLGKSLLALDLAARLISGLPFPDGAPHPHAPNPAPIPGDDSPIHDLPSSKVTQSTIHNLSSSKVTHSPTILFVDADARPGVLAERACAWGFDRSRLALFRSPFPDRPIDLTEVDQARALTWRIQRYEPSLLVVDSLATACPHAERRHVILRGMLLYLSNLAHNFDLAVLVIHHLRKRPPTAAARPVTIDDLRGFTNLAAAARSVLALSRLPPSPIPPGGLARTETPTGHTSPHACRLEVIKSNLAAFPPPLHVDYSDAPRLQYSPPPPAELAPTEPTQTRLCAAWLLDLLADAGEPIRPREIVALARDEGFARATLYLARRQLGDAIVDVGSGLRDPNKQWRLRDPAPDDST